MIDLSGTSAGGEDTATVGLELETTGFDSHRHGRILDGTGHRIRVLRRVGHVGLFNRTCAGAVAANFALRGIVTAILIPSLVWVISLQFLLSSSQVLPGVVVPATVASGVLRAAIDHLLWGKRIECASQQAVGCLHVFGGSEGPAGTALALILHASDAVAG